MIATCVIDRLILVAIGTDPPSDEEWFHDLVLQDRP
jgi:hypothetical protein